MFNGSFCKCATKEGNLNSEDLYLVKVRNEYTQIWYADFLKMEDISIATNYLIWYELSS